MKNLRSAVHGRVLLPGDDDFTDATRPWNLAVEQPVAAVVDAEDSDDVAALVRYARNHGLTVTAQPSGHGATGDVEVDEALQVLLQQLAGIDTVRCGHRGDPP